MRRNRTADSQLAAPLVPLIVAVVACLLLPGSSAGGPNYGGVILLHANPNIRFTIEGNYAGWSELRDCEKAVTSVAGTGEGIIVFALAAWDDFASPRLKAVGFGVEYSSPQIAPGGWGVCGSGFNDFELSEEGWPASGTGTTLVFSTPLDDRVSELYWFACYAYEGNTMRLIRHPDPAKRYFTDDAIPAVQDDIDGYGTLGFGMPGENPCGGDEATGACCDPNGSCFLQTRSACEFLGGAYLGNNTECSPNPCEPGMGACCIRWDCRVIPFDECLEAGGYFQGVGVSCDPMPCTFSTHEVDWGEVKAIYRDRW